MVSFGLYIFMRGKYYVRIKETTKNILLVTSPLHRKINNSQEQLRIIQAQMDTFYNELPFTDERAEGLRYYYKNDFYSYSDAIILFRINNGGITYDYECGFAVYYADDSPSPMFNPNSGNRSPANDPNGKVLAFRLSGRSIR